MRIVLAHNYYQQPGGEDRVFELERELLEAHGHEVRTLTLHNEHVHGSRWRAAARAVWSRDAYRQVSTLCHDFTPQVVHFHNTFMMMSPSVYWAARRSGAAVVKTLHNYRLFCSAATCVRDGQVCVLCRDKTFAWPGVRYGCYRGSRAASAAVATTHAAHRVLGTWRHAMDRYICLTPFARDQFIRAGLPAERLVVKPNFLFDPAGRDDSDTASSGTEPQKTDFPILFVGRLSAEKGVLTLLAAWRQRDNLPPLHVIGDGELAPQVVEAAAAAAQGHGSPIIWRGRRSEAQVRRAMGAAAALVVPSEWFEGFPMTIIEALSCGLPIAASRIGGLPGIVEDGVVGRLFAPGDPHAVADAVRTLCQADARPSLRAACLARFRDRYSAEANYPVLKQVYHDAIRQRSLGR